jgi:hypothetical protein
MGLSNTPPAFNASHVRAAQLSQSPILSVWDFRYASIAASCSGVVLIVYNVCDRTSDCDFTKLETDEPRGVSVPKLYMPPPVTAIDTWPKTL